MLGFLLRRLLFAVGTVVLTAFFAYGMMRLLRPDLYEGQALLSGTWRDSWGAVLHLRLGEACMFSGCPPVKQIWLDGVWADVLLLAGGLFVAIVAGVAGGAWCAARPRSRASRALEAVAMVFYCAPVYVIGLGLLLLFAPPFGVFELPYFFELHAYAPPLEAPWDFMRSMIVPWLVVGAPLAAAILRLTLALSLDTIGEDYVRTAHAKGVSHARVMRRHAAPASYVSVASLFGASAPFMITNIVLVEYVFSVPGFFRHTRRALGHTPGVADPTIDIPTLQALALWAAVLIVVMSLLADLVIVRLDPRVRSSGRALG